VTPSPEPTFQFGHKITQEVAYNLMPVAQLQQLHRQLAEWYERTYAEDLSPFHALLAYHWRRADVPGRAIDHLEIAGLEALRTFANDEAVSFFDGALSLMSEANVEVAPSRLARWHIGLGEAYVHMSRYRSGREQLQQGLRLLRRGPPAARSLLAASLVAQLARQLLHRIGLHRPRPLSVEERDELVAVCRAYERLAEASYYEGASLLPLYSSIRILNEAETSRSAPEIARGLAGTGALFGVVPLPRIAESYLRRALSALSDVDDATTQEIARVVIGFYYAGAADWDRAREQFLVARRTASRIADRRRLQDAVGNLLEVDCLRGEFGSAIDLADELITAARSRRDRRFEADALVARSYAAIQLGRFEAAAGSLDAVREIMIEDPDLTSELRIKTEGAAGLVALAAGDLQGAVAAADTALRLTAAQRPTYYAAIWGYVGPAEVYVAQWENEVAANGVTAATRRGADVSLKRLKSFAGVFPVGRPRLHVLMGRRHWLLGHTNDAFASWRRAADLAQQLSMPFELALAELELGRHGNAADGRDAHLQRALELFVTLGAAPRADIVRNLIAAP
jgi:tetratricopeptide (TPR) repeat protein